MTKDGENNGLKECSGILNGTGESSTSPPPTVVNGDSSNNEGSSSAKKKQVVEGMGVNVSVVYPGGNKENKNPPPAVPPQVLPGRKVSMGEPVGLPSEHLLPSPPKHRVSTSSSVGIQDPSASQQQKNGLKRRNSGRQKCRCWCCCCSCSCLALRNNNDQSNNKSKDAGESDLNCDSEPPPSLEEIRGWGESFDKLMHHGCGRKVFREFLKCEYSEENILFWLACEELKKERTPEAVEEKARLIYEDYISILSPKEVSLDSRVRDVVNENMRNPKITTFDEAQLQIYTLMHRDSYPRFVNSPVYKKLAGLNSTTPASGTGTPSGGPPLPGSSQRDSITGTATTPTSRKQSTSAS